MYYSPNACISYTYIIIYKQNVSMLCKPDKVPVRTVEPERFGTGKNRTGTENPVPVQEPEPEPGEAGSGSGSCFFGTVRFETDREPGVRVRVEPPGAWFFFFFFLLF